MDTLNIARMSSEKKIEEAFKRSLPLLPGDLRMEMESLLSPASLAIMAATLVAWMVSQAFGVGELADLVLLGVGLGMCGWDAIEGFRDLYRFGTTAMHAVSERDLDQAASYFASAAVKIGFDILMGILLKEQAGRFKARLARLKSLPASMNVRPNLEPIPPPPPPDTPPVSYVNSTEMSNPGNMGETDPYGYIMIDEDLPADEQKITLDHEMVHRFFSPKAALLRQFRATLRINGYGRVLLLRYLEEAAAEVCAQVRAQGIRGIPEGFRFPVERGYMIIENA